VSKDADPLKVRLKEAIVEHFRQYPSARDTERGILVSWLPRRGLEQMPPSLISEVLDELVKDGSVEIDRATGVDPLYSRSPNFIDVPPRSRR
jgi:hypothetical protein